MKYLVTILVITQMFLMGMVVGNNNQVSKASVGHVQPTQGGLTSLSVQCEVYEYASDCVQPANPWGSDIQGTLNPQFRDYKVGKLEVL